MIDKRRNLPGTWRGVQPALIIPGLVVAFSLSVSPVSAQTQASGMEEIVVSARKREESLHEVPNAITVLQEEDLRQRGITELNQVEKFAPNVVQTNFGQGNTGHAAVFMRGAGVQEEKRNKYPASKQKR